MTVLGFLGKKGFAMQFNWIFVLIGGAIIFGFFFSLINNLLQSEDVSTKIKATQEVDAMFKINLASDNTQKTIEFTSNIKINFFAERTSTYSEYSVEGSPRAARYDYNAIFSPNELEGDELIVQSFVLDLPFRSMPVVYVTNKEVEYVLLGISPAVQTVLSDLPEDINWKQHEVLGDMSSYPDRNYDRTVFVTDKETFDTSGMAWVRFNNFNRPAERIFAVVMAPGTGTIAGYGEISFYKYDPNQGLVLAGTSPFFDHKILTGAIISHDRDIYENNLRKVLRRINLLTDLYVKKVEYYWADNELVLCRGLYGEVLEFLDSPGGNEDVKAWSLYEDELSYTNLALLFSASNQLKAFNSQIVSGRDCPGIY
ncbi:hypothetical protein JXB28_03190 [Candidatus Woesearchaeota archaeon]|nr:hypothetical protein [Candidatus Woesearchaeota archaeon]